MKRYWKYSAKGREEYFSIFIRDYTTMMEKQIYHSYNMNSAAGWNRFICQYIKDERKAFDTMTIEQISEAEAFVELI